MVRRGHKVVTFTQIQLQYMVSSDSYMLAVPVVNSPNTDTAQGLRHLPSVDHRADRPSVL